MQVLAHNLLSQFTNRQLNVTTEEKGKNTEKLASGYKINRSADDSAGLEISENMRWQIRGLSRGKSNIKEGISLVGTADGALDEMQSILQRVRELSVQAYNDTNTEADRDAIQSEVDDILNEVDRIADTTTFNTKQLLRGNPLEKIRISADRTVERVTTLPPKVKDLPDWLKDNMDLRLEVHPNYTQAQDVTGTMEHVDPTTGQYQYYGPQNQCPPGFDFMGEWTPTIENNVSAQMDFQGLIKLPPTVATALDLYEDIYNLVGTKVSFPCGTCNTVINSLSFWGNEDMLTVQGFQNPSWQTDHEGKINLSEEPFEYNGTTYSGYFEAVQDLIDQYSDNYDSSSGSAPGDNNESADVIALAEKIAEDLRDKAFDVLDRKIAQTNHFDRVVKGDSPYSLIVYDYRDDSALTNMHAADATVKTESTVIYKTKTNQLIPGTVIEAEAPMKIMCGALKSSYIDIELSDASRDALGLSPYRVNHYDVIATYSDDYNRRMLEWESSATQRIITEDYMADVIDQQIPPVYGLRNGERVLIQPGQITFRQELRTRTYTIIEHSPANPPIPGPDDVSIKRVYNPDSLYLVDNAIDYVSDIRSRLGAIQNRLEYAYNLNAGTSENTQAAESRIRDTDMAEEMVGYAKHSILEQAGQSMLAQANQVPQRILSLLS